MKKQIGGYRVSIPDNTRIVATINCYVSEQRLTLTKSYNPDRNCYRYHVGVEETGAHSHSTAPLCKVAGDTVEEAMAQCEAKKWVRVEDDTDALLLRQQITPEIGEKFIQVNTTTKPKLYCDDTADNYSDEIFGAFS